MVLIFTTGTVFLITVLAFVYSFHKDRSRYRNCNLLFLSILTFIPFLLALSGPHIRSVWFVIAVAMIISLLIVPFFLIHNGIVMIRREGVHMAHMLSLALGIAILVGEAATFASLIDYYPVGFGPQGADPLQIRRGIEVFISVTVMYGSTAFLVFMLYTVFLQHLPRRKDFDYVIIHGAGLIHGNELTRLLKDRLDKAIEVYRKDPSPPVMIPSGGQGDDETVPEAFAMKQYLVEQGIPEAQIIMEDRSKTTYENLKYSKAIIDQREGRKYTALVTSNYHVYRALRYSREVGLKCTGIGSRVAFYYWPSALIREFIAIHAEKKHALLFAAGWLFWLLLGFKLFGVI